MTMNGVIGIILPYFIEFGSFRNPLISHQQFLYQETSSSTQQSTMDALWSLW